MVEGVKTGMAVNFGKFGKIIKTELDVPVISVILTT